MRNYRHSWYFTGVGMGTLLPVSVPNRLLWVVFWFAVAGALALVTRFSRTEE